MARLSGTLIGKKAGALTAALALGAAILALTPGQIAHAARGITNEAGDAGTGSGATDSGSGTATRIIKDVNDFPKCTITRPDGTVDFYLPGDEIIRDGKRLFCGSEGQWVIYRPGFESTGPLSGGVYTQAP